MLYSAIDEGKVDDVDPDILGKMLNALESGTSPPSPPYCTDLLELLIKSFEANGGPAILFALSHSSSPEQQLVGATGWQLLAKLSGTCEIWNVLDHSRCIW